jgi:glycosyltransferase involved in cell wall biosynthesis
MRVLYANHTSRVSGGELSLIGLLEGLPPGIDAAVACPEGELSRRLRAQGVEVMPICGTDGSLRLAPRQTARALGEMGLAAAQLGRAASRFRADLVHANSIRAGLIARAPAKLGHRPLVVHVRDCLPPGRASELTLRLLAGSAAVVANSAHTRDRLGPARASAQVVHNGIDLSRFERIAISQAEARSRLGIEGEGPVLAVIAQITPWKGQDDAIRIAAELRRSHPGLRLLLVGAIKFDSAATRHDNRAFLAGLHRQVAEQGLEKCVSFLGERDDVAQILAAVDLLLVPSWEEPFGRAIVEAMASGVAVAASATGGPAEIVEDGRTGLLLPPRDPRAWVKAIEPLLAEPARREAMASLGRERAHRHFGIERHVAAVIDVYAEVSPIVTRIHH